MLKHDAYRQVGYIQQALSQNRKPIGIFIGAGCPLSIRVNPKNDGTSDPIIPDVVGLTTLITGQLKGEEEAPSVCDKLIAQMKDDGTDEPNIEHILSQLRALRQVTGKGKARDFIAKELDDLDEQICKIIAKEVGKELPHKETPYHNLAIWVRAIPRIKPVHIFTTNYDLLVEQALEESSCPYFDGFIGSKKAFFDLGTVEDEQLLHPRWCRLWKVHGSINWKTDANKRVVRSDKVEENESYLIYPSHLKYDQSRKMPYLAMLDRLKQFIISPSAVLFISGYSFSDDHINDIIVQGLQSNPTAMTFALIYGKLDDPKYVKAKQCALQMPNLTLIAFDQGVIGRQVGDWIVTNEDLIAESPARVIMKHSKEEVNDGNKKNIIKYEFIIGDFAKFGDFLKEMSINHNQNDEKPF